MLPILKAQSLHEYLQMEPNACGDNMLRNAALIVFVQPLYVVANTQLPPFRSLLLSPGCMKGKAISWPSRESKLLYWPGTNILSWGRSFWVYCNPSTINNRALFGVRTCQPFSLGEMKPSSKDRWSCWDVIPIGGCFLNDQWEWPPLFDVLPRSIDTDNAYVLMQLIHKSFQYCSAQKNFANVDERSDRYGSQEFGGQMSAAVEALTTLTWIDYRVQFLDHFSSNTNEMSACL